MIPQILTYNEIRDYNNKRLNESKTVLKSVLNNSKNYKVSANNVFVSYSSKDSDLLPYILSTLKDHGGYPYVDIGDNRLPNTPSIETAQVLKDELKACKRLVVFITTNSKDSKWVPWELGLGDGAKNNYDIALFPTASDSYEKRWIQQEYLGLYQRIVWGKIEGYSQAMWMVYNHINNTATPLSNWLK